MYKRTRQYDILTEWILRNVFWLKVKRYRQGVKRDKITYSNKTRIKEWKSQFINRETVS